MRALSKQRDLFEDPHALPDGMRYASALVSPAEEQALIAEFERPG